VALDDAEAITLSDRAVDDAPIVELTALIAFQNMSSKFNAALDVPPQGFCRLPDRAATRQNGQKARRTDAERSAFERGKQA